MLLIIDNYDSFTYNLVHYVQELGCPTKVIRNDDMSAKDALNLGAEGVLISPGPKTPNEAGICLDVIKMAPSDFPIFGVCLGLQSIGAAFGAEIIAAKSIMHGKVSMVEHDGTGCMVGLKNPFKATRYHSLAIDSETLPDVLAINGWTKDGEIMSAHHKTRPIHGVQFHPESIASEHGHNILSNFLNIAGIQHG